MEDLNIRKSEIIENQCYDNDENSLCLKNNSKKLVKGINLKDLYEGNEVVFELCKGFKKNEVETEESFDYAEIIEESLKSVRENRGAPPLNHSFEYLASQMTNIDEAGFVKKQVITHGIGTVVSKYAYVTVHYNLYKENCELPFDSTYLRNHPEKFRLDLGETIPGLEDAIKSMKKNENSRFFIKWEVAFGALGCPDRIEPECDIVADVTLINFVDVKDDLGFGKIDDLNEIDFSKALIQAKQEHYKGNDNFNKGHFKNAIYCYKAALKILESLNLSNEEQETLMIRLKVKCLINLAVCYNKIGKYEQACLASQEVLSIDNNNAKAYFQYGKANLALSNFQIAQKLLLKANQLKPNDKDICSELKKLNEKKELYDISDKMFWRKAFKQDLNAKDGEEKILSDFETFAQDLKEAIEECVEEDQPYILPGHLLEGERKVCEIIAKKMNVQFETKEDLNIFRRT